MTEQEKAECLVESEENELSERERTIIDSCGGYD